MRATALRRNRWVIVAALVSLALTVQPFRDSDVWWHLAIGHYIVAHGIPAAEPFSFLHAANPWVGQQWLYDVALARVVDVGGAGLASLLMGVVASGALLVAALSIPSARRPRGLLTAGSLLLGAVASTELVGVRAPVMSLLGAAVTLNLLVRWRHGSMRALLALPPLMALWANVDAGFVVGIGMAAIALLTSSGAGRRARLLLGAATLGGVLATLVNPAGVGLWGSVAATFSDPTLTALLPDLQSPNFHDPWLRLFEVQAILLVIAWVLATRRDAFDLVLAGAVFAASLEAARFVSLFALVAVPQLAAYSASAWSAHRHRLPATRGFPGGTPRSRRAVAVAAAALAAAGAAVAVVPRVTASNAAQFEAAHEPKAAADYAAIHLAGRRLYTVDSWGGYLADRFPGGRVVYLYDQLWVFGDAAVQQYIDIHDLKADWNTVLPGEDVTAAILPAGGQEVSALLTQQWSVDCSDATSASLVMTLDRGASGAAAVGAGPAGGGAGATAAPPPCG